MRYPTRAGKSRMVYRLIAHICNGAGKVLLVLLSSWGTPAAAFMCRSISCSAAGVSSPSPLRQDGQGMQCLSGMKRCTTIGAMCDLMLVMSLVGDPMGRPSALLIMSVKS